MLRIASILIISFIAIISNETAAYTVRYAEKFSDRIVHSTIDPPCNLSLKSNKSTSDKRIIANKGDMPQEVSAAIDEAIEIFDSFIYLNENITLGFNFEALEDQSDIWVDISYDISEAILIPYSLSNQTKRLESPEENPDGIITLNSNTLWDIYNNSNSDELYSLKTAVLRGIAVALGFGSSVIEDNKGTIKFEKKTKQTVFDNVIFSSAKKYLKDIIPLRNGSSELTDFVQPENGIKIYAYKESPEYQLYAPKKFENKKSLVYFQNDGSIMTHDFPKGLIATGIDIPVLECLAAIGWTIPSVQKPEIISPDTVDFSEMSAYLPYSFTLKPYKGPKIENPNWTLSLEDKDGNKSLTKQWQTDSITLSSVVNPETHKIEDGYATGNLDFSGLLTGKPVSTSIPVRFSMKPRVLSIDALDTIRNAQKSSYWLSIRIKAVGAPTVNIRQEIDMVSYVDSYNKELSDNTVTITTKAIPEWSDSWVDIEIQNEYGSDLMTLEILCDEVMNRIPKNSISESNIPVLSNVEFEWGDLRFFEYDNAPYYEKAVGKFTFNQLGNATYVEMLCTDFNLIEFSDTKKDFWPFRLSEPVKNNQCVIIDNSSDWGVYYSFRIIYEDHSEIYPDTICSSSYLTDQRVIDYIQEELNRRGIQTSVVPVSPDEEFRILPDRIASDSAVDMECYDLYGRMIKRNKDSFLSITGIEKGIYIISATLDDGTRRSFKYRKTTP